MTAPKVMLSPLGGIVYCLICCGAGFPSQIEPKLRKRTLDADRKQKLVGHWRCRKIQNNGGERHFERFSSSPTKPVTWEPLQQAPRLTGPSNGGSTTSDGHARSRQDSRVCLPGLKINLNGLRRRQSGRPWGGRRADQNELFPNQRPYQRAWIKSNGRGDVQKLKHVKPPSRSISRTFARRWHRRRR